MGVNNFINILKGYLFNPEVFWPDDTLFHRRNREKIAKAIDNVMGFSRQELVNQLVEDLQKRYENKNKTLYVISCGSSGCHLLGEILSSIGKFNLIKEVYYPPALLSLCAGSGTGLSKKERKMLFDMVSYFPSSGLRDKNYNIVPVNIMHLRDDTPTSLVQDMGEQHLILLMRNPFDIAYSRSFRKDVYRVEADPDASDREYLIKQVNNVKRFFKLAFEEENIFDDIVRYEDLISNSYTAVYDLLFAAKEKFPEAWKERNALIKAGEHIGSSSSINYNSRKKEKLCNDYSLILKSNLQDLSDLLGYQCPDYIA
ncbi:hypothetical protein ACJJH9_03210 [Microbulbifer sp. DLAB2-AF]|uniref:hypothetical protein n=1 Tax=Microbulbifer sp. DLAB2-AF TaxID=3243395 RepID=UPI004038FBD3